MTFDIAFNRLMATEGGLVNNRADPGGLTKYGLSQRSYPSLNIAALTLDEARQVYLVDFWNRIQADTLFDGVAFQLFDFAVNSGIDTAVRYLQRAVGVADDGHWGPHSQAATDKMTESDLIMCLNAERLVFMTKLKNWPNASRGWARRIAANLRYGALDS
jgi:lysozyme family protein